VTKMLTKKVGNILMALLIKIKLICLDFEWATRLNRFMLNIVGIWPSAHKNAHDKFLSNLRAIFVFIVLIFIGAIPTIHSLVKIWGDLLSMIDNLQFTLPLISTIMKLVVIWWKQTGKTYANECYM
jgi:hypothetical protein